MFLPSTFQDGLSQLWKLCALDGLPGYKAIEQLSYLLALKLAIRKNKDAFPFCWEDWVDLDDTQLIAWLEKAIRELAAHALFDAQVFQGATFAFSKILLVKEVLSRLDQIFDAHFAPEWLAYAYSDLLGRAEAETAAWAGHAGKFYTPPHLAHLLGTLVRPQPGETICDYACGNGRLLAGAYMQVTRTWAKPEALVYAADGQPFPYQPGPLAPERQELLERTRLIGIDLDRSAALQAWVLLLCLGIARPQISVSDTLSVQTHRLVGACDVLLANPPYHATIDEEALDPSLQRVGAHKAELLFVARALQLLRPGGRAALILPDSVLFGSTKAAVAIRREVVVNHCLHAIISLPSGIFAPYTDVKTSIVVLTHSGETLAPWCYEVAADGYSLDKRRRPQPERTDFPDLFSKYCVRFAGDLERCRPAAFLDGDAALQWNNIDPARRAYYYVLPEIEDASKEVGSTSISFPTVKRTLATPMLTDPKDWELPLDELDDSFILSPGRYKPCSLSFVAKRPSHPPGVAASERRQPLWSLEENGTSSAPVVSTQAFYYLPQALGFPSLAGWYEECLMALRCLHAQGDITPRQHVDSLRLTYEERRHQELFASSHPLEAGMALSAVNVWRASDILPWFRGAKRRLLQAYKRGDVGGDVYLRYVQVLLDVRTDLTNRYGREFLSPFGRVEICRA